MYEKIHYNKNKQEEFRKKKNKEKIIFKDLSQRILWKTMHLS